MAPNTKGARMKSKDVCKEAVGMACGCSNCSTEPGRHEEDADLARPGFLRSAVTGTIARMLAGESRL